MLELFQVVCRISTYELWLNGKWQWRYGDWLVSYRFSLVGVNMKCIDWRESAIVSAFVNNIKNSFLSYDHFNLWLQWLIISCLPLNLHTRPIQFIHSIFHFHLHFLFSFSILIYNYSIFNLICTILTIPLIIVNTTSSQGYYFSWTPLTYYQFVL